MKRRRLLTGGAAAAALSASGLGFGCDSAAPSPPNEAERKSPLAQLAAGPVAITITRLPAGSEAWLGQGRPERLPIRSGATVLVEGLHVAAGAATLITRVSDPERKTPAGTNASFRAVLLLDQPLLTLLAINGWVYNSDKTTLSSSAGTTAVLPVVNEDTLKAATSEAGWWFADIDPLSRPAARYSNPIIPQPTLSSPPPYSGAIVESPDGRLLWRSESGDDIARARYYPWKDAWGWVENPDQVSGWTIRELADAQSQVFGVFNGDLASDVVRYRDTRFVERMNMCANQLTIGLDIGVRACFPFTRQQWATVPQRWAEVSSELAEGRLPNGFTFSWARAERALEFAETHGMRTRSQDLCWGADIPDVLKTAEFTTDELVKILEFAVKVRVLKFKGRVHEWDAAHELGAHIAGADRGGLWQLSLGSQHVDLVARWVKECDPGARVVGAEDHVIDDEVPFFRTSAAAFWQQAEGWRARRAQIDAIGIENNLWIYAPPTRARIDSVLKRVRALGFGLASTEMTVCAHTEDGIWPSRRVATPVADPLAAQAEVYRTMLAAYLDAGGDFALGGLTDATIWTVVKSPNGRAAVFDDKMRAKPAYFALRDELLSRLGT